MLKKVYLEAYEKLKTELSAVDYVAITCDSWTSVVTESYLTVTCHYLKDFGIKAAVLSTKPLPGGINHTSENISQTLQDIFNEWEIDSKVMCIITDNAANMKKACELLQKKHLPCYAHTLNLVVQECLALNDIQVVVKKVKEIVTFFKSSYVAMDTFKKEQETAGTEEPLKLLQDVSTRWNSTFLMIQRILKLNDAVGRTLLKLRKAPAPLSVDDIAILADIEKLLKYFEEATKKVSGDSYVTISLIIPLSMGLHTYLVNCLTDLQTEEGKTLCRNLLDSIKKRLYPYEGRTMTKLGTILDPRFKKEGFQNVDNAGHAATLLEQEMCAMLRRNNLERSNLVSTSEEKASNNNSLSLFGFIKERVETKTKSIVADAIIIKRQYLERINSSEETDPLFFWKIAGQEYHPMEECCLAALRFYASGSHQEITGSNHFLGISQPSLSRSIAEVTNALNQPVILNAKISFPRTQADREALRTRFFQMYGFPGIMGVIDCTHVAIVAPPGNDLNHPEHIYVNRKNYHSLNVQLICDTNLKIVNINSRFPGSSHDAFILSQSPVSNYMEQVYRTNPDNALFLIGDSGYPTRPWLLTPLPNPVTPSEERFNERFRSIRSLIERCNGVLKNRFRCLIRYRTLHYRPVVAGKIANACALLHNMCIDNNLPEVLEPHPVAEPDYGMYHIHNFDAVRRVAANPDLVAARQLQHNIIINHFNRP